SPVAGAGMVATAWSADGTKLAFIRFDESAVPEFPITWYTNQAYPERTKFKYPKVGAPNSRVSVHVHDLATGQTTQTLPGTEHQDIYLPRIYWTPDNLLCTYMLNREQNNLSLVLYDPAQHNSGMLLDEMDEAYVDLEVADNLVFLPNNSEFLWMSERDGHTHIYLLPRNPAAAVPVRQLTQGDFDVTRFYGLDTQSGRFYYQTATPTPMDRQVWEGSIHGGSPRLLTPGPGMHEAVFSPTFEFFVHQHSTLNSPTTADLCTSTGEALRSLVRNDRVARLRDEYGFAPVEFFSLKAADDTTNLNGWMLKPKNFDPQKKYPVLFDVYGGPGSQTVKNEYNGYTGPWHQMLAQKGYIVVSVDNRGTGARGRAFKKCTQLQLGKLETEDQIAAARQMGAMPFVDPARIGIWGWSFGGYLSSSCVLKGNDVFRMAMAVAPVTNWKWYDSAYTERFMHTTADNSAGYEQNSPINFVGRLRGDNYLICHGTADDNVHWQQTTEMVRALVAANKPFETHYYPNRNHGIYGDNATRHLFAKLTAFVLEKL
ncbi:MAG: DPP IV N-terminal domain-containing protein, partial [Saprospiraceae bacterium]